MVCFSVFVFYLFIDYVHANTCTHTLIVNTGISVSVAIAIGIAGVAIARINNIEWRFISGACRRRTRRHVALMKAAYIERIAEHAVQRVGHRARIIIAARRAARRY